MSDQSDPLAPFHPAVRAWFEGTFGCPTPPQALGWPAISAGRNTLILAPTASGKTLAAFLWFINHLYERALSGEEMEGVQVLYVSPLKALNYDIHRNLEEPLRGIAHQAQEAGAELPPLRTAVRTGDTPAADRQRMVKHPPHILITTPESLYLLLTSARAREMLRSVRFVIVDEIHALARDKRGVHLSLSLERLERLAGRPLQRIGLSATQRPLEEIARFLGGQRVETALQGRTKEESRPVHIVDAGARRGLDLEVLCPVEDMRELPGESIWPSVYQHLLELIQAHRSTLVFVNNRQLAERISVRLNELAGRELVRTHHGSLAREVRRQVEERLKAGELPALVATSSLELGIDIGSIDLVVQIESPKSVSRGLQRVGRSGHLVAQTARGRIIPKYRADLAEAAVIAREMRLSEVEATRVPRNCLDVLAQQVVAMAIVDEWEIGEMLDVIRGAYPYRELTRGQLENVLEMLSGRYPSQEFRELRPRIVWDRVNGRVRAHRGSRAVALTGGGTIPDRGYYGVYLGGDGVRLGELDEEFVFESRPGDVFLLGSATWRIESVQADRVVVSDAHGALPRMPFWKGEGLGRPLELGQKLGAFARWLGERLDDPDCLAWLREEYALDERAAVNLRTYFLDQREATGEIPSDRAVVVEHFLDELGDHRVVVHSPFGGRVHAPWSLALAARLREELRLEVECVYSDSGILFRFPSQDGEPPLDLLRLVTAADVEELVLAELINSPLFGTLFRYNASRSLLLPRRGPGRRTPLWLQRLRAADLLQIARRQQSFPVVLETYRECLQDVLDVEGLRQILREIEAGEIEVVISETAVPSPFAFSLLFDFIGVYMYRGDVPKAERRSQMLTLNRELLQEILGSEGMRELLDPRAIHEVEARLQRTLPGWRARTGDELADVLLRVGDLAPDEVSERVEGDAEALLRTLEGQRRAVRLLLSSAPQPRERWIATEDFPLYRDAFGADERAVPPEVRSRCYAPEEARELLLRRYVLTHGPFQVEDVMARYGFEASFVASRLAVLQAEGVVSSGEYTRGRSGCEWCDAEVLRQIHRRTLSMLRREVEPVSPADYASFLLRWQGYARPHGAIGSPALRQVIEQLQGLPLPAEVWESEVLPRRLAGYQAGWLDGLCSGGDLAWVGSAGGQGRPGRIAFYLREDLPQIRMAAPKAGEDTTSREARLVRAALAEHGASFQADLAAATGLPQEEALEALWELAWVGEVTNDTFEPVRHVRRRGAMARPRPMGRRLAGWSSRRELRRRISYTVRAGLGRWSLLPAPTADVDADGTRAECYARQLLRGYGVVAREMLAADGVQAPWLPLYEALKRMELLGEVRRGYFIRGLSGAQFALPEAVEHLRSVRRQGGEAEGASPAREEAIRLLSACDPANPYGSIFPLPGQGEGAVRFARVPSSYLIMEGGRPLVLVEGYGRRLTPLASLSEEELRGALRPLEGLLDVPTASGARRRVVVEEWEGRPIAQSAVAPLLAELGFLREPGRMVLTSLQRRSRR